MTKNNNENSNSIPSLTYFINNNNNVTIQYVCILIYYYVKCAWSNKFTKQYDKIIFEKALYQPNIKSKSNLLVKFRKLFKL